VKEKMMNRFSLLIPQIDVTRWREVFASLPYVEIALLFGSRAVGRHRVDSDYDFAVLGQADLPYGLRAEVWKDISSLTGLGMEDFDVVDLSLADDFLKECIKEEYRILKGDARAVSRILG
jgi:predicted nucleotidyltransferase